MIVIFETKSTMNEVFASHTCIPTYQNSQGRNHQNSSFEKRSTQQSYSISSDLCTRWRKFHQREKHQDQCQKCQKATLNFLFKRHLR